MIAPAMAVRVTPFFHRAALSLLERSHISGFLTAEKAHLPLVLGREFGIDNANPICMEEPVLHVLCFTEFYLRQFGGLPPISSLDVDRTLADFSFVPVFAKYIFHKPSDIARHASLLFRGGNYCPLSKRTAREGFSS